MNVPGITSPDMSATINGAVKAGWVYIGTGKNHTVGRIQWPTTGAIVTFSTTPRSGGWKTVADMIFKESGVDLRRKGSNRRSRKNFRAADPQVEAARRKHRKRYLAERAQSDIAAELVELEEACRHASNSLRADPNNPQLRAAYEAMRRQYARAVQDALEVSA